MKYFLVSILVLVGVVSYSQIEETPEIGPIKNSLGAEHRIENFRSSNFVITYRRYFESPYNFKASLNVGGRNNSDGTLINGDLMVHETNDSLIPLVGISDRDYYRNAYQRLELGIEREFSLWNLNFIVGVDGFIGHLVSNEGNIVWQAEEGVVEQDGIFYKQYQVVNIFGSQSDNTLNQLDAQRNYLLFGGNINFGLKVNFSEKVYATGFTSYRIQQNLLMREENSYSSEQYKEYLPARVGGNSTDSRWFYSIGLHYKF